MNGNINFQAVMADGAWRSLVPLISSKSQQETNSAHFYTSIDL